MLAKSTSKFKGQGTLFFILIGAVGIIVILATAYLFARVFGLEMESKLFIKMEINDEGRELASFLEAEKTEITYMEVLGELFANNSEHLESELENINNTLGSVGKDCVLIYKHGETEPLRKIGKCPDEVSALSESDIPIPGAVEGKTKGRVRVYESKQE